MYLSRLSRGLVGLLLPADCAICEQPLSSENYSHICRSCWDNITIRTGHDMLAPTVEQVPVSEPSELRFHVPKSALKGGRLYAATTYTGTAAAAIQLYKYAGRRGVLRGLRRIIDQYLLQSDLGKQHFDAIIPVPLHPARERERGFNQAEGLAQVLAARLGQCSLAFCLTRVQNTRPQTQLSGQQRRENVADAFILKESSRSLEPGSRVLLVDDVCTTGSTLRAAATPLVQKGVQVEFFVLARVHV